MRPTADPKRMTWREKMGYFTAERRRRRMNVPLKISVVVATYNRAETLRETIHHLTDQDLDPACYEVVIADDGSPDHTRQVVEEAMKVVPFHLTYVTHPNHGIGYTQNRGLEAAKAPIVLMMADDIFMMRQALKVHVAMHEARPEPEVAIQGRVVQSPRLTESVFLRTWDPFRFSSFSGLTELPYYRFWACHISAKREFVISHGAFREHRGRAGAACHEDSELGYRLHQAGLRIFYCKDALGHHHHVVSLKTACIRAYEQGLNFDEYRMWVPEPEISVAYHVLRWSEIGDHLRAWFGPRRHHLTSGDRNPALLLARCLVRALAFNALTVRFFWEPIFAKAEHDPTIARLMRPSYYRGLIAYHFFRGCREGNIRFGVPRPQQA